MEGEAWRAISESTRRAQRTTRTCLERDSVSAVDGDGNRPGSETDGPGSLHVSTSREEREHVVDAAAEHEAVKPVVAGRQRRRGRPLRRGQSLQSAFLSPATDPDAMPCLSCLQIEESYEDDGDLETNLLREEHARLSSAIANMVDELQPSAPDFALGDACDQIVSPSFRSQLLAGLYNPGLTRPPRPSSSSTSSPTRRSCRPSLSPATGCWRSSRSSRPSLPSR